MITKANVKGLSLIERKRLYMKASKAYYNTGTPIMSDAVFDYMEDLIRKEDPAWAQLKKTGVKVGKKFERALAVPCPSLEKIKDDNPAAVGRFLTTLKALHEEAFLLEKIDGASIQGEYEDGHLVRLATRGDGQVGKDISHFIPHLSVPKKVTHKEHLVIRFEAVVSKKDYEKKWADEFDSDRIMASALLNRQDVHPALKDIQFIGLKVQKPLMTMDDARLFMSTTGIKLAKGKRVELEKLSVDFLVKALTSLKEKSEFSCDGIVVTTATENVKYLKDTADKPDYSKAFKVNEDANAIETVVTAIEIKPSSFGVLVPKAVIAPIKFGNVTVRNVSVSNFRFCQEKGIDVGAKVKVLRSGDIIPKIVAVTKPVKFKSWPSRKVFGEYEWDDNEVNLVLVNKEDNAEAVVNSLTRYFTSLELDSVAKGLAQKLYDAGYRKTSEMVALTEAEIAALPGIKTSAAKLAKQLARVREGEFNIIQLMVASGVFDKGVGSTRLKTLHDEAPQAFLRDTGVQATGRKALLVEEFISTIKGCGPAFAKLFVAQLPAFWDWMDESGAVAKRIIKSPTIRGSLSGERVSFTGYRDKVEEAAVVAAGALIVSFGSKTTILLHRTDGKASGKVAQAQSKGITVKHFKELKL